MSTPLVGHFNICFNHIRKADCIPVKEKATVKLRLHLGLIACGLWVNAVKPVNASTISVNGFSAITSAVFVDLPVAGQPSNIIPILTARGVTITPNTGVSGPGGAFLNCGSFPGPAGTANIPGNGLGICGTTDGTPTTSITFSFSVPVAAYGASLQYSSLFPANNFTTADLVQAFSGPNRSGTLIGSILSSGLIGGSTGHEFVGLLSTTANIQSAVISGTGLDLASPLMVLRFH